MKTSKSKNKFAKRLEARVLSWDLRKLTKQILFFSFILAIAVVYLWYARLYMTNERRFWLAIENSMSTRSVTRTINNGGTGNAVVQSQRFAFSPQMASESKVTFDQKSALVETSVATEGVLFPDAQYSRYTAFETNQQKPDGTVPSLDSVLGKWEGNDVAEDNLDEARLGYVSELVSLVIFGNFDDAFRDDVVSQFKDKDVYGLNLLNVTENNVEGQDVLSYSASISLREYATQLQRAFVRAGYGEFPPLNPENYRADSKIPATILVSKKNNNIVGVSFGDRNELYSGYGINRLVERPEVEYGPGELEAIVQNEIQGIL